MIAPPEPHRRACREQLRVQVGVRHDAAHRGLVAPELQRERGAADQLGHRVAGRGATTRRDARGEAGVDRHPHARRHGRAVAVAHEELRAVPHMITAVAARHQRAVHVDLGRAARHHPAAIEHVGAALGAGLHYQAARRRDREVRRALPDGQRRASVEAGQLVAEHVHAGAQRGELASGGGGVVAGGQQRGGGRAGPRALRGAVHQLALGAGLVEHRHTLAIQRDGARGDGDADAACQRGGYGRPDKRSGAARPWRARRRRQRICRPASWSSPRSRASARMISSTR
jgi:hypothetical protein